MIEYDFDHLDGGETRRPCNEWIKFVDGKGRYDLEFQVWHHERHVVTIRGSTASDILHAFLRQASIEHLKAFRLGIDDQIELRGGDND